MPAGYEKIKHPIESLDGLGFQILWVGEYTTRAGDVAAAL